MADRVLSGIDAEITKRQRRMKTLAAKIKPIKAEYDELRGQIERLKAIRADWEGKAPAMPAPSRIQNHRDRGTPIIDQRTQDVLDCLAEHGTLSPGELLEHLRWTKPQLKYPLERLLETGKVIATGATKNRRYSLAEKRAA